MRSATRRFQFVSFAGRWSNALGNLAAAATAGADHGARGFLITDWGDYGHHQYFPISYPGLAAGAGLAWCVESNRQAPLKPALNLHVLRDSANIAADVLMDLGNVYQAMKEPLANGSRLFWTLLNLEGRQKQYENVTIDEYADALERIDRAVGPLDQARMAEQVMRRTARHAGDVDTLIDISRRAQAEIERVLSGDQRPATEFAPDRPWGTLPEAQQDPRSVAEQEEKAAS